MNVALFVLWSIVWGLAVFLATFLWFCSDVFPAALRAAAEKGDITINNSKMRVELARKARK